MLALFIIYEIRIKDGILDKELITNRTIAIGNISAFFIHLVQMASFIPLPFYLQVQLGYDPWMTGLILSVQPLFMGVTAPFAGRYRDRQGPFIPLVIGPVLGAVFMAVILFSPTVSVLFIVVHLALFGIAMGFFHATNNTEIMSAAPDNKVSHTGSMLALIRYLGMIAGIGLAAVMVGKLGKTMDSLDNVQSGLHGLFVICLALSLGVAGLAMIRQRRSNK